jgi:membrane protein involved in colicin uptake
MATAEEKAAAKAAADAKKAEEKAAKEAEKAAAEAKKAEEKAAAKAAADAAKATGPITVKYRDHTGTVTERTFSQEVHGDNFAALAAEFKVTNAKQCEGLN